MQLTSIKSDGSGFQPPPYGTEISSLELKFLDPLALVITPPYHHLQQPLPSPSSMIYTVLIFDDIHRHHLHRRSPTSSPLYDPQHSHPPSSSFFFFVFPFSLPSSTPSLHHPILSFPSHPPCLQLSQPSFPSAVLPRSCYSFMGQLRKMEIFLLTFSCLPFLIFLFFSLFSEEEAEKKIYNVSCERYFGFGCETDEGTSNKLFFLFVLLFML